MEVIIIDDTHQSFNGVTYRRNKRGWFQIPYSTIHRDVWEFHYGKIPDGYDIHHIDGDKANNQIDNLMCVTRKEHRQLHAEHADKKEFICCCLNCWNDFKAKSARARYCPECRKARQKAQAKARREAAKANKPPKEPKPPRLCTCVVCGKEFELKPTQSRNKGTKTCSPECHQKLRFKLDDKICAVCGKIFHPKHAKQKYCSPECRQIGTKKAP